MAFVFSVPAETIKTVFANATQRTVTVRVISLKAEGDETKIVLSASAELPLIEMTLPADDKRLSTDGIRELDRLVFNRDGSLKTMARGDIEEETQSAATKVAKKGSSNRTPPAGMLDCLRASSKE